MANTYKQIALLIIPFVFLLLRNAADPRVCHAQQPSGEASCQEKGAQQFLTQATGTWHARTVVLGFLFAEGLCCVLEAMPMVAVWVEACSCLLYTSPSPRD